MSQSALIKIKSELLATALLVKMGFNILKIYHLSNYINILSSILLMIIQFFLWRAVYESNVSLSYSFDQIFIYMVLTQVLVAFFPSNISRQFSLLIKKGDIIHRLLKPYGLVKQFFFESIGAILFNMCYVAMPLLLVAFIVFNIHFGATGLEWHKVVPFIFMLQLSCFFIFMFEIIVGLLSFYTLNTWGLQSFKYAMVTIFSGRFLPLSLYPDFIRQVVDLLPFKMMYFLPVNYMVKDSGQTAWSIVAQQVVWNFLTFAILMLFLKFTLRKLMIQGG